MGKCRAGNEADLYYGFWVSEDDPLAVIQKDKKHWAKGISLFMRMLAGREECLEFDPAIFTAFVEKVVVSGTKKDVRMRFVLRDVSEYKIDGVC